MNYIFIINFNILFYYFVLLILVFGEIKGFSSFGINCNDCVIVGGIECVIIVEDIYIIFW